MKRLVDGREVAGDSQEWAAECLARYVARKMPADRRLFLDGWKRRHGDASTQKLLDGIAQIRNPRPTRQETLP